MTMTAQEIFDRVVEHLRKQRQKAIIIYDEGNPSCRYRTEDGRKCAIGALIPDEFYNSDMEGRPVASLCAQYRDHEPFASLAKHPTLAVLLQGVHDNYNENEWETQLKIIAHMFGLRYTPCSPS